MVLVPNELLVHSVGIDVLCAESVDNIRNSEVIKRGG